MPKVPEKIKKIVEEKVKPIKIEKEKKIIEKAIIDGKRKIGGMIVK